MPNPVDQDRLAAKTGGATVTDLNEYKKANPRATVAPYDVSADVESLAREWKKPILIFFAVLIALWFARRYG